jgi:hypothetical protein
MINKHENISVSVYWDTSAFLDESCQGDRTQQSVLKTAKSTIEVHSVWHIYVATETGGQMRAFEYYSARLRKSDRERAKDVRREHKYYNNFSAKKQNRSAQTRGGGGSAVLLNRLPGLY